MLLNSLPLQVDIVSAESTIFSGQALMVTASGVMGELGIVHGHSPLLTLLKPGQVRLFLGEDKEDVLVYVKGGLLEVQPNTVTVLADVAIRAADLDEAQALAIKERAEQLLAQRKLRPGQRNEDFEYSTALADFAQASAQLKTIQDLRKKAKSRA